MARDLDWERKSVAWRPNVRGFAVWDEKCKAWHRNALGSAVWSEKCKASPNMASELAGTPKTTKPSA
eukprot:10562237-Karenia_brevis.AAC.1